MNGKHITLFFATILALFVVSGCAPGVDRHYSGDRIDQTSRHTGDGYNPDRHNNDRPRTTRDRPTRHSSQATNEPVTGKRDVPIKQPVAATPPPAPEAERKVELPKDITTATFSQLWFVSRQWEVGSYKDIVRAARVEINRRGKVVLPDVLAELPVEGGLEQRAFIEYFESLGDFAAEPLVALLDTEHKGDSLSIIVALQLKAAIPGLRAKNTDDDFGRVVCRVLATLGDKTAIPALLQQYEGASEQLKLRILIALKGMLEPSLLPFFINECGNELVSIRRLAENCILAIGAPALPELLVALPGSDIQKYRCLLEVIGMIGTTECSLVLLGKTDKVATPDWRIRFTALRSLQSCKLAEEDKKLLAARMIHEDVIFCRREYSRLLTEEIEWKPKKQQNQ